MFYFAYGSNMSTARLKAPKRVPFAKPKTTGTIFGHALKFNKVSKDRLGNRSGKGHIEETGNQNDLVYGVVFEITEKEKPALDRAEGLGYGYAEKTVTVTTSNGEIEAITYYGTNLDDSLKPYDWYMGHVIAGARENDLPADYIAKLEQIEATEDPNPELHDT
jgi:cation transport regulator ChaC